MKKFLKWTLIFGGIFLVGKAVYDYLEDKKLEDDESEFEPDFVDDEDDFEES